MDSLFDVLSSKDFDEPPEIAAVKKYVQEAFQIDVSVQTRQSELVIIVSSAALANSLRLRLPELKRRCQLDKRVIIRIS